MDRTLMIRKMNGNIFLGVLFCLSLSLLIPLMLIFYYVIF